MSSGKGGESVELSDLEVDELLRFFIGALAGKSLEYLGVSAEKEKPVKDLRKAQLAINSVSALVDQLASVASEDEVKQLRALLSDLQLSYVAAG
jgi:hypothetical protein